jgi:hypothetical protein
MRSSIEERNAKNDPNAPSPPPDAAAILETLVTLGRAHKREGDVFTL